MKKRLIEPLMKLAASKTARHTYFIFAGNSLGMVCAFFFTVLLFRMLSVSDFGYFSALLSFLLLTSDVADFGIGSSLSRFLPAMEKDRTALLGFLKTAFLLQLTVALILSSAIAISAPVISQLMFHDAQFTPYVRIMALGIFGTILYNFFLFTMLARQRFLLASIYTTANGLFRLVFLLAVAALTALTFPAAVWVQAGYLIILAVAGFFLIEREFFVHKATRADARRLVGFSVFLGISRGLTAIAGRLDVIMIVAFTNSVEAGIYATASRVVSLYPVLSGSFSTVIAPKIAAIQSYADLKKFLAKVGLTTLGLIASVVGMIIFAHPFLTTLFGMKAEPAVGVFQVLLVGIIFFVASIIPVSLAIYYIKKPFILSVNSVIQVAIVTIGNLILIPLYGRYGAAYSLIGAYGVTLVVTSVMCYYYLMKMHGKR